MAKDRELRDLLEALQVEVRELRKGVTEARRQLGEERARFAKELGEKEQVIADLSHRLRSADKQASTAEALLAARKSVSESLSRVEEELHIVALGKVPEDLDDSLKLLSSATGLSRLDLTLRLRVEPPVPLVRLPRARAEALVAALRENGIPAVTCDVRPPPKRQARRLVLTGEGLQVELPRQERLELSPRDLQLVVVGQRSETKTRTQLERVPNGFDSGTTLEEVEVREDSSETFLWLFALPDVRLAVSPSTRLEGFALAGVRSALGKQRELAAQLQAWAPAARLDDRLVRLARFQAPLLGQQSHVLLGELLWTLRRLEG